MRSVFILLLAPAAHASTCYNDAGQPVDCSEAQLSAWMVQCNGDDGYGNSAGPKCLDEFAAAGGCDLLAGGADPGGAEVAALSPCRNIEDPDCLGAECNSWGCSSPYGCAIVEPLPGVVCSSDGSSRSSTSNTHRRPSCTDS